MRLLLPLMLLVACSVPQAPRVELTPNPWPMSGVRVWTTMSRPSGLVTGTLVHAQALSIFWAQTQVTRELKTQEEWRAHLRLQD